MSKFDTQIHCEEITYTPTAADWAEYHDYLESLEVEEEYQDSFDPVDLYGAEWENHAVRAWD